MALTKTQSKLKCNGDASLDVHHDLVVETKQKESKPARDIDCSNRFQSEC